MLHSEAAVLAGGGACPLDCFLDHLIVDRRNVFICVVGKESFSASGRLVLVRLGELDKV